jgi:hypothetical protein
MEHSVVVPTWLPLCVLCVLGEIKRRCLVRCVRLKTSIGWDE